MYLFNWFLSEGHESTRRLSLRPRSCPREMFILPCVSLDTGVTVGIAAVFTVFHRPVGPVLLQAFSLLLPFGLGVFRSRPDRSRVSLMHLQAEFATMLSFLFVFVFVVGCAGCPAAIGRDTSTCWTPYRDALSFLFFVRLEVHPYLAPLDIRYLSVWKQDVWVRSTSNSTRPRSSRRLSTCVPTRRCEMRIPWPFHPFRHALGCFVASSRTALLQLHVVPTTSRKQRVVSTCFVAPARRTHVSWLGLLLSTCAPSMGTGSRCNGIVRSTGSSMMRFQNDVETTCVRMVGMAHTHLCVANRHREMMDTTTRTNRTQRKAVEKVLHMTFVK